MEIEIKDKFQVVTPADGKVLTNGDVTSECLYMPVGSSTDGWSEIDTPIEEEELDNETVINELTEALS